jgi:hypothetical protein
MDAKCLRLEPKWVLLCSAGAMQAGLLMKCFSVVLAWMTQKAL